MRKWIDLMEIFSMFGKKWCMEKEGCGGSLFLLWGEGCEEGVELLLDCSGIYDGGREKVEKICDSCFCFEKRCNEFRNEEIVLERRRGVWECWEVMEGVCGIGNRLFRVCIGIDGEMGGVCIGDRIEIWNGDIFSGGGSYSWKMEEIIGLLGGWCSKVRFERGL